MIPVAFTASLFLALQGYSKPPVLLEAHSIYDNACCEDKHCHPVPCEEVMSLADGWIWRNRRFDKQMFRLSPDGACHVCIAAGPVCIYLPSRV